MLSVLTVLSNFNPFIKMDGYWIVSDILGVEDLHKLTRDVVSNFFKKNDVNKPLTRFKRQQKMIILTYILLSIFFMVYFALMIGNAFIIGTGVLTEDINNIFTYGIAVSNISLNGIVDYISSRIMVFISLFFGIRMLYMLLRRIVVSMFR